MDGLLVFIIWQDNQLLDEIGLQLSSSNVGRHPEFISGSNVTYLDSGSSPEGRNDKRYS